MLILYPYVFFRQTPNLTCLSIKTNFTKVQCFNVSCFNRSDSWGQIRNDHLRNVFLKLVKESWRSVWMESSICLFKHNVLLQSIMSKRCSSYSQLMNYFSSLCHTSEASSPCYVNVLLHLSYSWTWLDPKVPILNGLYNVLPASCSRWFRGLVTTSSDWSFMQQPCTLHEPTLLIWRESPLTNLFILAHRHTVEHLSPQ